MLIYRYFKKKETLDLDWKMICSVSLIDMVDVLVVIYMYTGSSVNGGQITKEIITNSMQMRVINIVTLFLFNKFWSIAVQSSA